MLDKIPIIQHGFLFNNNKKTFETKESALKSNDKNK